MCCTSSAVVEDALDRANIDPSTWTRRQPSILLEPRVPTFFHDENLKIRYEPFPIGQMAPAVDNGKNYRNFVRTTPIWSRFDRWIRSPEFIDAIMGSLNDRHLDLGYRPGISRGKQTLKNVKAMLRGRPSNRGVRLAGSWEFQMIPANGGYLLPHTDAPSKIVTMTLSMVREGEWDTAYGGGLDLNRPKSEALAFNQLNVQADFKDMDVMDTFEFLPNTGVVFIKTFNSWHSVRPIQGPEDGPMRRNLVINIMAR
jgi:hypothetical protein